MTSTNRIIRNFIYNPKLLGASISFFLLFAVYCLTVAPSASFWDCPEYISAAWKLEIGHPPGNPLWMLVCRVLTIPFSNGATAALVINLSSGLFTALAGMLLYLCLFDALTWLGCNKRSVTISSLSATLIFGWCDSVWFSAVEAEVYALSLLFTALALWLMVRWALTTDQYRADRLLLLNAYIFGLSMGVHQLNLLMIPALSIIYAFKRFPHGISRWRLVGVITLSFLLTGLLLIALPAAIAICGSLELLAVNTFGLPYLSGVWITALLAIITFSLLFRFLRSRRMRMILWGATLYMIGCSVYAIIPIRGHIPSQANAGMPSDPFSFAAYQSREQYASNPLIYGQTPFSRPMLLEERDSIGMLKYQKYLLDTIHPVYIPAAATANHHYICSGYKLKQKLTPELDMWFPRIQSRNLSNLNFYRNWAGMSPETMDRVSISEAIDSCGNFVTRINSDGLRKEVTALRPTYIHHLRYMLSYQIGYMYFRYLLWNFSGRQNDIHSTGEASHGNFLTCIPAIDEAMLGAENLTSELTTHNRGYNRYFMIPILLGIFGLIWLCCKKRRGRRLCVVISAIFLMTGIAIVLYLNQNPGEPRERDYSFLGSYMAFAGWIAASLAAMIGNRRIWLSLLGTILAIFIPFWMLAQNYDDHDRSGNYEAINRAKELLTPLHRDAVIFVDGDNYTFPLWYAQEVEQIRTDVRVINLSYLARPQYLLNCILPWNDTPALRSSIKDANPELIRSANPSALLNKEKAPSPLFRNPNIPVDSLFSKTSSPLDHPAAPSSMRKLLMLDLILSNPDRAFYWAPNLGPLHQLNLDSLIIEAPNGLHCLPQRNFK